MNFITFQKLSKPLQHITCNKGEQYCILLFNFSGHLIVDINHESATVFILGIYIGSDENEFRLNTIQHHKKAQQSNAYQKNQNILMSRNVFVDSRPYLEIEADDVACTHGSTTGKLSNDSIDFLNLRGLDENTAKKLLLTGFIEDIFNRINNLGWEMQAKKSKMECLKSLEIVLNEF